VLRGSRDGEPGTRACPVDLSVGMRWIVAVHDRHDVTEEEWARLEPLLPDRTPRRGGRWTDHRSVINGVLWRAHTSCLWRDLPRDYGHWKAIYHRHRRWSAEGIWASIPCPGCPRLSCPARPTPTPRRSFWGWIHTKITSSCQCLVTPGRSHQPGSVVPPRLWPRQRSSPADPGLAQWARKP
jgi:transposase